MLTLRKHLIEGLLTLAILGGLALFLAPLGNNISGRNDRYLSNSPHLAKETQRKEYVQQTLPQLAHKVAMFAGASLACLWLGRLRLPSTSYLALHAFIWLGAFKKTQAFGWPWELGPPYLFVWYGILLLALSLVGLRYTPRQPRQYICSPLIFPGFILFTAIGVGWLADYSANGPLKNAFLGITHLDTLALSLNLLTLTAAQTPRLLSWTTRFLANIDTAILKVKPRTAITATLLLGIWLAAIIYGLGNSKRAAFLAESVRLPTIFIAAWFCYRWLESEHGTQNFVKRGLFFSMALCGLLALTDHGQLLLLSACLLLLLAAWLSSLLTPKPERSRHLAHLLALAIAYGILYTYRDLLLEVAPTLSVTAEIRGAVIADPYHSPSDFLAVLQWFHDASEGLGLGHIPWCSYINLARDSSRCNGIPEQIQSDYTLIALFAIFGWKTGLALLASCIAWLLLLTASQPTAPAHSVSQQAFKNWLLAINAAFLVPQTLVSAAGSLGLITMTGVPIPMFSLGKSSLLSLALFCGIAINHTRKEAP